MHSIGMLTAALGTIAVIWGIMQRMKAGRVAGAPLASTGDAARRGAEVADQKGALSAQGRVIIDRPLRSPVSGTECPYFKVKCTARWKDGDESKEKISHKGRR